jgi:dTDP-glucose 4,6-dehydratase
LLEDGHDVVGVDNLITGQRSNLTAFESDPKFQFIEQDICTPLKVDGPVGVLFNFACPASPVDFLSKALEILRVCSDGVRNLLEVAREKGAIFVHASTSECYGDPAVHPQKESYWGNVNPVGERSPYDEGKRFAESLIMTHHRLFGIKTRIGRIFNTYGPRMRVGDGRALPNFIQQALENRPLTVFGAGQQTRSFCYVTDLVEGFIRLSRCDDPMPINLGNPTEMTIIDLAREVIERTGSSSEIERLPLPADDPKLRCPDITRAREILGWEPTIERGDGLGPTIDYFRSILCEKA